MYYSKKLQKSIKRITISPQKLIPIHALIIHELKGMVVCMAIH